MYLLYTFCKKKCFDVSLLPFLKKNLMHLAVFTGHEGYVVNAIFSQKALEFKPETSLQGWWSSISGVVRGGGAPPQRWWQRRPWARDQVLGSVLVFFVHHSHFKLGNPYESREIAAIDLKSHIQRLIPMWAAGPNCCQGSFCHHPGHPDRPWDCWPLPLKAGSGLKFLDSF